MVRLREFSVVMISPSARGTLLRDDSFHCHVVAVIGDTAALEPLDPACTQWLPEWLDGALLSFHHGPGGALIGLKGQLCVREGIDDIRFTVTDGVQVAGRRATRVNFRAPIMLRPPGAANWAEGHTVDLSAYGILVDSELDVAPGDAIEFSLALAGVAASVDATATVARVTDSGFALDLDGSERTPRSLLARFVVDHNLAMLRHKPVSRREIDF